MLGSERIHPQHVAAWAKRVRGNLLQWDVEKSEMTRDQSLAFIRQQYATLALINGAIDGRIRFTGVDCSALDKGKINHG